MAIVKCSECGKEISDSAERCPACGCVTKRGQVKTEAKGILIAWGLSIAAIAIGLILFFSGIDDFSIVKIAIASGLLIGGAISIIRLCIQAKELSDYDEKVDDKSVIIIKQDGSVARDNSNQDRKGTKIYCADGSIMFDNGIEWKCTACGYSNPSALVRCYNCGNKRHE